MPITRRGRTVGLVGAAIDPARLARSVFDPAAEAEGYLLWMFQDDGRVLFSRSADVIGENLFTAARYAPFPEIRSFAQRVLEWNAGAGFYPFYGDDNATVASKIAVWVTLEPRLDLKWKLVIVRSYDPERAVAAALTAARAGPANP